MTNLCILFGRNSELSTLEWEGVASGSPLHPTVEAKGPNWLRVQTSATGAELYTQVLGLQRRLGGTIRIIELLSTLPSSHNHTELATALAQVIQTKVQPEAGKINLGISLFGTHQERSLRLAQFIKRELTEAGYSIRFVTARDSESLNAAQVKHNRLALTEQGPAPRDFELVCLQEDKLWHLGLTLTVQDIASYTKRDFGIPRPNPTSGMLPPKLAQMMINLGLRNLQPAEVTVYDPFCGNGRVVLEALLLGVKSAQGSDIAHNKVAAARENLAWFTQEFKLPPVDSNAFFTMDATAPDFKLLPEGQWVMVGEPFLGPPLRQQLTPEDGNKWLQELTPLYISFLEAWAKLPHKPERAVLVFPRARLQDGTEVSVYEAVVDRLANLGYSSEVLFCYDRPDALVRRDLVSINWQ